MTSKFCLNVALRDAIIVTVALVSISSISGYAIYLKAASAFKEEVKSNLSFFVKGTSGLVDGDLHEKLLVSDDMSSENYNKVKAPLNRILEGFENIDSIYTLVKKDNKFYFIMNIPGLGQANNTIPVMTEYKGPTPILDSTFATQDVMVENELYSDELGTFLSAYAPIYNSKKEFIGVIGADLKDNKYYEGIDKVKESLFSGTLVAMFVSILSGVGVWFVRNSAIKAVN